MSVPYHGGPTREGVDMIKPGTKYRQVRLTLTEEREPGPGDQVRLTLRVMVKPTGAQWTERHTVLHQVHRHQEPLDDLQTVYRALRDFLASPPLPGHIG